MLELSPAAIVDTWSGLSASAFHWLSAGLLVLALGLLIRGSMWLRRARCIDHTPTSRVRSAAQGYVELEGLARLLPGPLIVSPLTGTRCCWWSYRVEHRETVYRNGRRSSQWSTLDVGTSDDLFLLADTTGECIIDPEGAKVVPSLRRRWCGSSRRPHRVPPRSPWFSFGSYRYTERLIRYGDPLYAIGWFRSQGAEQSFRSDREVTELLAEWKRDQGLLLEHFDRNADGRIDLEEWQQVRKAASLEVRKAQIERAVQPDLHVLCRPRDRRPYLLSTDSQAALIRNARWRGRSYVLLGILTAVMLAMGLQARGWV